MESPRTKSILLGLLGTIVTFLVFNIAVRIGFLDDIWALLLLFSAVIGVLVGFIAYNRAYIRELENKITYLDYRIDRLNKQQ